MERTFDDFADQASILREQARKAREASQALRAISRQLCKWSEDTRERSADIQKYCRVNLR
jgi:hypothetical protein